LTAPVEAKCDLLANRPCELSPGAVFPSSSSTAKREVRMGRSDTTPLKVLFIGNSFTARNDPPA
jgi:hypothetical protein